MVHRKYRGGGDKLFPPLLFWSQKVTRFTLLICQHVSDAGDLISRNNSSATTAAILRLGGCMDYGCAETLTDQLLQRIWGGSVFFQYL
jgi:hypothetical protein